MSRRRNECHSHSHTHTHSYVTLDSGRTQLEYMRRMWLTVQAPVDVLFCDDLGATPLWRRLVSSLPDGRI